MRSAGREDHPRHRRQLRHPQASQGSHLAGAKSAMDLPLHADLRELAQRRRGPLLRLDPPSAQTRRHPLDRRYPGRHQPLRRPAQPRPQALLLDCRPSARSRRCQSREPGVRLASLSIGSVAGLRNAGDIAAPIHIVKQQSSPAGAQHQTYTLDIGQVHSCMKGQYKVSVFDRVHIRIIVTPPAEY